MIHGRTAHGDQTPATWRGWRAARATTFAVLALASCGASPRATGDADAKPFEIPLARSPLTPPLVVTGGFGEYRVGHFHAGFDFGTGGVVGKPVFAPLGGHVERIRASGVGYGRSLYVRARDGRLLQFGHLDAFAEPMASWVAAKQDSSGQYEQDLWPEAARFPVRVGQRIAWTGQSGAGGPHMHFEIRRGDMAYHPMLAGLVTRDERAPSLASLTLEPLDDTSYVEGSAAPVTRRFGARAETLRVIGRVRAVVGARDGLWRGVDRMVPWLTRMDWGGRWIECRMDSISWATDMSEGDYVYDAGRVVGEKGIVLWASSGFRPRFIRASEPPGEDAGTIRVRASDPPLTVKLEARDLGGHVTRRTVVVLASRGPDPERTLVLKNPRRGDDRFEFAALPRGYFRVTYRGNGAGTKAVWIGFDSSRVARPATPGPEGWTAVVRPSRGTFADATVSAWGRAGEGAIARDAGPRVLVLEQDADERSRPLPIDWNLAKAARFDSSAYLVLGGTIHPTGALPPASAELAGGEALVHFGPESEPLRQAVKLTLPASGRPHAGVYRHDDDGWAWVGDKRGPSPGNRYEVESRRLGWFAEFADTLGPRITLRAPRPAAPGPYSRWALEAVIAENGSGVDARASYFVVDGRRVPAEWDSESDVLRWRPLKPPPSGSHRYDVVAGDRAGNLSVRSGTFVLD